VIAAARHRFATEGPAASLRDIARDADVNLGLIHRHFGSKEALVREVLAERAEIGYLRISEVTSLEDALRIVVENLDRNTVRVIAGVILAGEQPYGEGATYPTLSRLLELAGDEHRSLVLVTMLTALAWQVFAELATAATGYASEEDAFIAMREFLQKLASNTGERAVS
jgi:AcrR family transcriptional regulator